MADITIVPPVMLASTHGLGRITGIAGEAIPVGSACYVKDDGLIWMSDEAYTLGAQFDGVNILAAAATEQVTIFQEGYKINIGAHGLAIGAFLYPSGTAGAFSDASICTPNLTTPIAKAISDTEIMITRMDLPAVVNAP